MIEEPAARILFIARSMHGGGAERFVTILLRHIDRSRFIPILGLVEKKGPFLADIPEDIEVIDLKVRRVRYVLPKIIGLVHKKRPDLIFSSIGYVSLVVIAARPLMRTGIKIIARETNIPGMNIKQSPFPYLLQFLYRKLYPRLHKAICQSKDMQEDLVENFGVKLFFKMFSNWWY